MLSAHGSPPEVIEAARRSGGTVIDAVCPLVTKVHHELKVRARKGYTVLYVGHEGHEEAVGTMAVAPESVHLIESTEDIDALGDMRRSVRAAEPDHPQRGRVASTCASTPRRSSRTSGCPTAVTCASPRRIARPRCAPSPPKPTPSSSSDRRTRRIPWRSPKSPRRWAARGCCASTAPFELPDDLSGTVAVTAGASAPESLVNEVLDVLDPD